MAPEKEKRSAGEATEHQDQSIKARKFQLFEGQDVEVATGKSFAQYVKETPPAPMAPGVKAALWAVGVLVVLLLLASLFGGRSRGSKGRHAALPAARHAVAARAVG